MAPLLIQEMIWDFSHNQCGTLYFSCTNQTKPDKIHYLCAQFSKWALINLSKLCFD